MKTEWAILLTCLLASSLIFIMAALLCYLERRLRQRDEQIARSLVSNSHLV